MAKKETAKHIFAVAGLLCLVCSVLVSVAAVSLRSRQNANKQQDKRKNILIAAGLFDEETGKVVESDGLTEDTPINDIFTKDAKRIWIETVVIDLETGKPIDDAAKTSIEDKFGSLEKYDQKKASRDTTGEWSAPIAGTDDVASVKRREKYGAIYIVRKADGSRDQIVLPIRGYGLWSTLWGFLSLDDDLVTVRGLTFYEHGETPGLGGEVDNLDWKKQWKHKQAFDDKHAVKIKVIKGKVQEGSSNAQHEIDGLSGATITSRGVSNMMKYWLGENGYGPLIERLREEKTN